MVPLLREGLESARPVPQGASARAAGPERTCIGCGAKAGPSELVRLIVEAGQVVVARRGQGGRGAWLHPGEGCLDRALKRKAMGRAFRQAVVADPGVLRVQLTRSARKD